MNLTSLQFRNAQIVGYTLQQFTSINLKNKEDQRLVMNALFNSAYRGQPAVINRSHINLMALMDVVQSMYSGSTYGASKFDQTAQYYFKNAEAQPKNGQSVIQALNANNQRYGDSVQVRPNVNHEAATNNSSANGRRPVQPAAPVQPNQTTANQQKNTYQRNNNQVPFLPNPFQPNQPSVIDYLEPFVGQAVLKQLANDPKLRYTRYSKATIYKSIKVLEALNDTGASFTVQPDKMATGRINAVINDTKMRIRLLTDPDHIGTVMTNNGSIVDRQHRATSLINYAVGNTSAFVAQSNKGPAELFIHNPQDPKNPIHASYYNQGSSKLVYGKDGKPEKKTIRTRSGQTRQVYKHRRNSDKRLQEMMVPHNRAALVQHIRVAGNDATSPNGSKQYLKTLISHAILEYTDDVLGPSVKGTDPAVSSDQQNVLEPYMKKNGLSDVDRKKVESAVKTLVGGNSFTYLNLNKAQRGLLNEAQQLIEHQDGVSERDQTVTKGMQALFNGQGSDTQKQQMRNYMKQNGLAVSDTLTVQQAVDNPDSLSMGLNDKQLNLLSHIKDTAAARVGSYEDGFDPNMVVNMERLFEDNNVQNEVYLALNDTGYPKDQLKTYRMKQQAAKNEPVTSDPSLVSTKDHMLQFNAGKNNSNIAYSNDTSIGKVSNHPHALDFIANQLKQMGIVGASRNRQGQLVPDPRKPVTVAMDKNHILRWKGYRRISFYAGKDRRTGKYIYKGRGELVQGDIGQLFLPDKNHILHTQFNSGDNFNVIPSYKGWFQYKGMKLHRNPQGRLIRAKVDDNGKPIRFKVDGNGKPVKDANGHLIRDPNGSFVDDKQHGKINLGKPAMQRLRLSGYTQMLHERLREDLGAQLRRMGNPLVRFQNMKAMRTNHLPYINNVDDLTSPRDSSILNGLYHSELTGERVPNNWLKSLSVNAGMTPKEIQSVLRTKLGRISFDKHYAEINTDAMRDPDADSAALTDGKSMKNMGLDYRNIMDLNMTSGGKQQGLTLHLVAGAHLHKQPDGTYSVSPLNKQQIQHYAKILHEDPNTFVARAAIGYLPVFRYLSHMPWDRKSVAGKYYINELFRNMLNVRTAYMTFGGDNMEDSTVITTDMANKYKVPDRDLHGNLQYVDKNGKTTTKNTGKLKMRPLKTGDKIDDFGHNKATVGLVIDPKMDMKKAKAMHIAKEVAIFRQNPGLQIIMSPHSPITRGNGAIADQAMAGHGKNVKPVTYTDENGHKHKLGTSSLINFMALILTSDKQTTTYDAENVRNGKTRKMSSQMTWGLNAQHYVDPEGVDHPEVGDNIMRHTFGHNYQPMADWREYFLTTGIDLDRGGAPVPMNEKNISANHPIEHRQKFIDAKTAKLKGISKDDPHYEMPRTSEDFLKDLGSRGGTLVLPFKVHFQAWNPTRKMRYKQISSNVYKKYGSKRNIPWDVRQRLNKIRANAHVTSNQLPILSAHLRSNMTLLRDGKTQINDYNGLYAHNTKGHQRGIFETALAYGRQAAVLKKLEQDPRVQQMLKDAKIMATNGYKSPAYKQAHQDYVSNPTKDGKRAVKYAKKMQSDQKEAQADVNQIAQETILRKLGGLENGNSVYNKHSFIREKIMARALGHSSTAVSQNDMRLPLDTIAVSPHIYATLFGKDAWDAAKKNASNVTGKGDIPKGMTFDPHKKNMRVLLTRDPVIYTGSERGFKVVADTDKYMGQGFKMPAVNDNSFKGDNDGDTYSVINVGESRGVQKDLKHMSVPYQLIDTSGPKKASFLDVASDFIAGAVKAGVVQPQYITKGAVRNVDMLKKKGYLSKTGSPSSLKKAINANHYNHVDQKAAKQGIFGESPKQQLQNILLDIATERVVKVNGKTKTLRKSREPKAYEEAKDNHTIDNKATIAQRAKDSNNLKDTCIRNDFGASNLDFSSQQALFDSMNNTVLVQGAKGKPKAVRTFNDYRLGVAANVDIFARKLALKTSGKSPDEVPILLTKSQMDKRMKRLNKHLDAIRHNPKAVKHYKKLSKMYIDTDDPKFTKNDAGKKELRQLLGQKANARLALKSFKLCDKNHSKNYVDAFNMESNAYQDTKMQNALASKAFNTASAGTKPQQLVSAFGDLHPNLALEVTYQETQANLQGKHHPDLIPTTEEMLYVRVPHLLNGIAADAPSPYSHNKYSRQRYQKMVNDAKSASQKKGTKDYHVPPFLILKRNMRMEYGHLTVKDFTKQYCDTFKKAGTGVNPKYVKHMGQVLSLGTGTVKSVKKTKEKYGSPTLKNAYDGTSDDPGGFNGAEKLSEYNGSKSVQKAHKEQSFAGGCHLKGNEKGSGYYRNTRNWFPDIVNKLDLGRQDQKLWNETKDKDPFVDPRNMTKQDQATAKATRKLYSKSYQNKLNQTSFHDRTAEQKKVEAQKAAYMKQINAQNKAKKDLAAQPVGAEDDAQANEDGQSNGLNDGDINYMKSHQSTVNEPENEQDSQKSEQKQSSSKSSAKSHNVSKASTASANSKANDKEATSQHTKQGSNWRDYKQSSIRAEKRIDKLSEQANGSDVSAAKEKSSTAESNSSASSAKSGSASNSYPSSSEIAARQRSYNASKASEAGDELE